MADLEQIAAAADAAASRTPSVVLNALVPTAPAAFGLRLRKFSLGAYLALEKLDHPFVRAAAGSKVEVTSLDVATALFVMVTPSADVFAAIESGDINAAILETADRADMANLEAGTAALMAHLERGLEPSMPMRSSSGAAQKKTADSAGS